MGSASPKRVLVGRIGAAHGIRGEVRLQSFTGDPLAIAGYGQLSTDRPGQAVTITEARPSGTVLIAVLAGVTDRNAAEKLNGTNLYLDREQLPEIEDEDDFYHADLIGLEARLADGKHLGKVTAVPNFGAGDLLEIVGDGGEKFFLPFTRAVVPEVRVKDGYLLIEPPRDAELGEEEPD